MQLAPGPHFPILAPISNAQYRLLVAKKLHKRGILKSLYLHIVILNTVRVRYRIFSFCK